MFYQYFKAQIRSSYITAERTNSSVLDKRSRNVHSSLLIFTNQKFKAAKSWFVFLEKVSLNLPSLLFVIRVNLLHR